VHRLSKCKESTVVREDTSYKIEDKSSRNRTKYQADRTTGTSGSNRVRGSYMCLNRS
jgi:hypothetical protein